MNRVRTVLVVVMSLLLGGVVFEVGRGEADPWGYQTPGPPRAPKAPKPPKIRGGGISISINGNKIKIDGLDQLVSGQLQNVGNMLANHPNLPKDVRDKIVARMDRVRAIVDKHVKNLDTQDFDTLDDQLEKMGDELEKAMEGLESDLEKLGEKLGKDLAKDLTKNLKDLKLKFGPDRAPPAPPAPPAAADDDHDDDDTDDDNLPNVSVGPADDDLRAATDMLKDFALKPGQKDAIAKLRADTDLVVETERKALDNASQRLETALADVKVNDADIARYVDKISAHEAVIRKARLLSWVHARRVLDADQIKQLEAAAHRTK